MKEVTDDNLHGAFGHGQPLGVVCCGCGKRSLVPLERIGAHSGNMTAIRTLRFKCSDCDCHDVQLWLFLNREQADAFGAGQSGAQIDALRHAGLPEDDWRRIHSKPCTIPPVITSGRSDGKPIPLGRRHAAVASRSGASLPLAPATP